MPPRAEPAHQSSDVVMEARVSARSFRIATAESQRSKIVKMRGTGALTNRCRRSPRATSHTFNRPFAPFPESCLWWIHHTGISVTVCVSTLWFSLLKSAKIGRTDLVIATNTYLCSDSKGLTGLGSKSLFLPTNKAARFSQSQVRSSAPRLQRARSSLFRLVFLLAFAFFNMCSY